ncbi:MAG: phosphoribosylformylglycinamidine synthase subunit PurS [Clostridia bacterium]|nr:phosphoribosylformylglycinamidine synthase subunit PurS [Clostridia bacterium]
MYQAKIYITLKDGVLDPQGSIVEKTLHAMDHKEVQKVKVGKYIEVLLDQGNRESAEKRVDEICKGLLANSVIEEYTFELVEVGA